MAAWGTAARRHSGKARHRGSRSPVPAAELTWPPTALLRGAAVRSPAGSTPTANDNLHAWPTASLPPQRRSAHRTSRLGWVFG